MVAVVIGRSTWVEISFGGKQVDALDVVNERKEQTKDCFFDMRSQVDVVPPSRRERYLEEGWEML